MCVFLIIQCLFIAVCVCSERSQAGSGGSDADDRSVSERRSLQQEHVCPPAAGAELQGGQISYIVALQGYHSNATGLTCYIVVLQGYHSSTTGLTYYIVV